MLRHFLWICLTLLLCACSNKKAGNMVALSELPQVNIPAEFDYTIEIKSWMAIGPFESNPLFSDLTKSFFHKDLERYGIDEGLIDEVAIEKLQRKGVDAFLINEPSPQIKLFKYISGKADKKTNFYLVAKINSAKNQDATLIIDGSNSYTVWLNEDILIEVRGKYNTNKVGDRFLNISLKEGENTLFVKINRGTNMLSWDLICAIAPRKEAKRIFCVNYASDFVINPIVNTSIEVYTGPFSGGKVELMDSNDQIVASGAINYLNTNDNPFLVSIPDRLENGFYKTILTVDDKRLEEMIYKGSYNEFVKKIESGIDNSSNSSHVKDLKVAIQRVDFLNDKPGDPNSSNETRFINRNRVFWGYSLYEMINKSAYTQFMTYNDKEDNSGIFIFHNRFKQKKNIPLVIIVPSALQGNSMIEDWYTSNLDQIEIDNALADQYEIAIAWIYAEGRSYSSEKTEKEIEAVINRLQQEYDIDIRRIFIMGDCEGGRRALTQLALSPDRYAACVVFGPLTLSGGIDGVPVDLLPKMGEIPIKIFHGVNDDISPIENSRKFYVEAKKLNMPIEFTEMDGNSINTSHVNIERDYHRQAFDFFNRSKPKQE
jgi:Predicted peptidase